MATSGCTNGLMDFHKGAHDGLIHLGLMDFGTVGAPTSLEATQLVGPQSHINYSYVACSCQSGLRVM